jgi:hypothetical protein
MRLGPVFAALHIELPDFFAMADNEDQLFTEMYEGERSRNDLDKMTGCSQVLPLDANKIRPILSTVCVAP